jgi:hypothetical protein
MEIDPRARQARHLQRILDAVIGSGMVYGPLRSGWNGDRRCLVAVGNWKPGVREPYPERAAEWGNDPSAWPPAAACSTLAGLVVGAYLDMGPHYDPRWGRSMARALRDDPFLAPHALWNARGARDFSWGSIADGLHISTPLTVVLYRSHVSLVLDADAVALRHPRTGETLSGRWVLSADGGFRDTVRYRLGRRLVRRLYCGRPITFEPADVRAKRDTRRVALVGIRPPRWPPRDPVLAIDTPRPQDAAAVPAA